MQNIGYKSTEAKKVKHPVIEIFGPTIQGEGLYIGQPVHFIRFGGCDYDCSWCDSKYAVNPAEVKKNSTMMTDGDIIKELSKLPGKVDWVVLSGGNPALQHLERLMRALFFAEYKVMVETQGTIWRPWLMFCDHITVSPKPPSSGNVTTADDIDAFRNHFHDKGRWRLSYKIVVYDIEQDMMYLEDVVEHIGKSYPTFVSIGNDVGNDSTEDLLQKTRQMVEIITDRPNLSHVRILPQLHVLLYGNARGV